MSTQLLSALSQETGIHPDVIRKIAMTAPSRYKYFEIPKKSGGLRLISQPAREVKSLQRAVQKTLLDNLQVHVAATAYRPGKSLLDNALPHAANGPILKMDLKDFFPSISAKDWQAYCESHGLLTDEDIEISSHILFHRPRGRTKLTLAIGAPSSPHLSNVLMYDFDCAMEAAVASDHVTYTRYADDLTFSAPRTGHLNGVIKAAYRVVKGTAHPRVWVNKDKTRYVTKKYHRVVTGLTISNDGRVTLGRNRKKLISAAVHRCSLGFLEVPAIQQLAGWLAYAKAMEPSFVEALHRRYGSDVVRKIQCTVVLGSRRDAPLFPRIPLSRM